MNYNMFLVVEGITQAPLNVLNVVVTHRNHNALWWKRTVFDDLWSSEHQLTCLFDEYIAYIWAHEISH